MRMEVEYRQTPEDLQAFEAFHRRHGPKMRGARKGLGCSWIIYIALGVWAALFVTDPKEGPLAGLSHSLFVFGIGAIAGGLGMLGLLAWIKVLAVAATKKMPDDERMAWIFAPRRLVLTPEGIETTQEYRHGFVAWRLICFVGASDDHLFLYDAPTQAYVVPRRAFPDRQQFAAFVALARQYHQGRAPANWPQPPAIKTNIPTPTTDVFRPDTPEPTP
jgi:hypothetical protein